MKTPYMLLTLIIFIASNTTLYSQDIGLFRYPEPQTITLTEQQQTLRENAEAREYSMRTVLVRINQVSVLKEQSTVMLNLPNGRTILTQQKSLQIRDEQRFTWNGTAGEPASTIQLVIVDEEITGWIRSPEYYFMLQPLGNGLHMLIEVDPKKFPEERPPLEAEKKENGKSNIKQKGKAGQMSDPQIDILVVYTQQAANQSTNISSVIYGAQDGTNQSFTNSNVPATVNVVHSAQVNYNESGNIDLDLCRITTSPSFSDSYCVSTYGSQAVSGYMNNVHTLRDQYGADLVVLLVSFGGAGVGWINSTTSYGFTVVRWDLAVGNYTFAHEIGHNIGGHHDTDNANNPHYAYGHGYRYLPANWRTIMAYAPGDRINYWSNPDITFGGVPMGTVQDEDNVRVWEERAATVASFRTSAVLSAQIDGLFAFSPGSFGFWNADVSGGIPPYNYSWLRSYSSAFGPFSQVSTSSSYAQTVNQEMWLKLNVTDSNSNFDQDIMHIYTTGGGGGGGCSPSPCPQPKTEGLPNTFTLSQNYPNPFNPTTTIKYELSEQADVRLSVYNILGRRVATLVNTSQVAGFYEVSFDGQGLASGLYIARLEAVGNSGTQFVRELKMQMIK